MIFKIISPKDSHAGTPMLPIEILDGRRGIFRLGKPQNVREPYCKCGMIFLFVLSDSKIPVTRNKEPTVRQKVRRNIIRKRLH